MKIKKEPMRQCLGCNVRKTKKELMRVVRTPEGSIVLDRTGKVSGRGAYICPQSECFAKAKKSGRIARSLEVSLPEEVLDQMEEELTLAEQ